MGARAARSYFPHTALWRRQGARLDVEPIGSGDPPHCRVAEGAELGAGKPRGDPVPQLRVVDYGGPGDLDGGTCHCSDLSLIEGSIDPPDSGAQRGQSLLPRRHRRPGSHRSRHPRRRDLRSLPHGRPQRLAHLGSAGHGESPHRGKPDARGRRTGHHHLHVRHYRDSERGHAQLQRARLRRQGSGRTHQAERQGTRALVPAAGAHRGAGRHGGHRGLPGIPRLLQRRHRYVSRPTCRAPGLRSSSPYRGYC